MQTCFSCGRSVRNSWNPSEDCDRQMLHSCKWAKTPTVFLKHTHLCTREHTRVHLRSLPLRFLGNRCAQVLIQRSGLKHGQKANTACLHKVAARVPPCLQCDLDTLPSRGRSLCFL